MTKWQEDLADVQAIYDDVVRFRRMTIEEWKTHLDSHPEDRGLHHINLPERGHVRVCADSTDRFFELTKRLIDVTANNADLDLASLNSAIRTEFVEMFLRQQRPIERSAVDRMLSRALKAVKQNHRPVTHYLACTLVGDDEPPEFRVGPVRFIHEAKFFDEFGPAIEADHRVVSAKQRAKAEEMLVDGRLRELMSRDEWEALDRKMLDGVPEYYKPYKWVAEVTVPACDDRISRTRAEVTVQAALDVLKLFVFGWDFGRRLRLGVNYGIIDKVTDVTRNEDGQFAITWRRGAHWAFVRDGWFDEVERSNAGYFKAAGDVIETYLDADQPNEIATRWLDALNWYGQAVSERIPSAQVVKYVAALERLTITERTPPDADRGLTDAVTRRAALFASFGDETALQAARKEARDLYGWRCDLMHGRNSPVPKQQSLANEVRALVPRADELVSNALIGALGEYAHVVTDGVPTSKALEERLRVLEDAFDLVPKAESNAESASAPQAPEKR